MSGHAHTHTHTHIHPLTQLGEKEGFDQQGEMPVHQHRQHSQGESEGIKNAGEGVADAEQCHDHRFQIRVGDHYMESREIIASPAGRE